MTLFIFLINLIEVLLFSSFIAYFFDLKNKLKYITMTSLINFTFTNLSSVYSYDGTLLILFVLFVNIVGLIIQSKKMSLSFLFIPTIYSIIILLGTTISLIFTTTVFSVQPDDLFSNTYIYYLACIMSKCLQLILSIPLYVFAKNNNIKLKLHEWWPIIVIQSIMVISIGMCLYSLIFDNLDDYVIKILLPLLFISNFMFYHIIFMSNKNYQDKIKNEKEILKLDFNKQKYQTINQLKADTEELHHRMYYILWLIELYAQKNDINQIKSTAKKYKALLNKKQYIIHSGNDIFDSLFSSKLSKYSYNNTDLKVSIAIQKNDFYDNLDFINQINNLMDLLIINSDYIDFNMLEINSFLLLNLDIKHPKDQHIPINKIMDELALNYHAKYNIHSHKNGLQLKISIPINDDNYF